MITREELNKRLEESKGRRRTWERMWEDCIDMTMPGRQSFYQRAPGIERTDRVFDETPILSTAEFTSWLQSAIFPPGRRWFRIEASEIFPYVQRIRLQAGLDQVTDYLYRKIMESNFDRQLHECFMDLAIGTCGMHISLDPLERLRFKAVSLTNLWLDEGPDGEIGGYFRCRENLSAKEIVALYPSVSMTAFPSLHDEEKRFNLNEATVRDYSRTDTELWEYRVWIDGEEDPFLVERDFSGWGNCPWVSSRWSETAEEVYGRGPLINLLPAIRGVNLLRELIFENAELAIGGIWQYPNDGTINPDQIEIAPNTFIPKSPGSAGLEPLVSPSRFDVAEANLQDLRETIKRGLFVEGYTPTGRTPLSAMEVAVRQTDLANRIGSPFSRIVGELMQPIILRVARLCQDAGLIEIPRIDGRMIRIISVSPLARAQKAEDIQRMSGFIGTLVNTMGPEAAGSYLKTQETVQRLADLYEYPADLLHDNSSRVQEVERNRDLQRMLTESLRTMPQAPTQALAQT